MIQLSKCSQIGLSALILELFYRFVWARYTFSIFQKQVSLHVPGDTPSNTMEESVKASFASDEVIETKDLGEGEDVEEEEEEEDGEEEEEEDLEAEDGEPAVQIDDEPMPTTQPNTDENHEASYALENEVFLFTSTC